MRLDGYFDQGEIPTTIRNEGAAMPFGPFAFYPVAIVATSQWPRFTGSLRADGRGARPTRYDRALRATAN